MSEAAVAEPVVETPVAPPVEPTTPAPTSAPDANQAPAAEVSTPAPVETPPAPVEPSPDAIRSAVEAEITAREEAAAENARAEAATQAYEAYIADQMTARGADQEGVTDLEKRALRLQIEDEIAPIVGAYDAYRLKPLTQAIGTEMARLTGFDAGVMAQMERTHPSAWPGLVAAHLSKTGGVQPADVTLEWVEKHAPKVLDEMHARWPERGIVKPASSDTIQTQTWSTKREARNLHSQGKLSDAEMRRIRNDPAIPDGY